MYHVILAGGSGSRFWPQSRTDNPKQLLKILGDETMVRQTYNRLSTIANTDKIPKAPITKPPPIPPEVISSITESVFSLTTSALSVVVDICNKGFISMILILNDKVNFYCIKK